MSCDAPTLASMQARAIVAESRNERLEADNERLRNLVTQYEHLCATSSGKTPQQVRAMYTDLALPRR